MLQRLEASTDVFVDPYHMALARIGLDDRNTAAADLQQAAAVQSLWHAFYAQCDPRIDPIRVPVEGASR